MGGVSSAAAQPPLPPSERRATDAPMPTGPATSAASGAVRVRCMLMVESGGRVVHGGSGAAAPDKPHAVEGAGVAVQLPAPNATNSTAATARHVIPPPDMLAALLEDEPELPDLSPGERRDLKEID